MLKESSFPTIEDMEADFNKHESEIDANLPDLQKDLLALLA
jgi:hypothetical protein